MEYVIITGAAGGMGKCTAQRLASLGYGVFALDRRKIEAEHENIIPLSVDVTDEESVRNVYQKVCEITEKVSAIIHFAGVYVLDSLVEISESEFKRAFEVNLFGVYRINKQFLPLVRGGGRIIITTSELAPLDPLPFTGLYAITKSALDKYAYSLRMEVQLLDISVTVIRAGAVDTGLLNVSTDQLDRFCEKTELYQCNADRFKSIVNGVEAKNVAPQRIAQLVERIMKKRKPKYVYCINRNPLLLILNALPHGMQTAVIKKILKKDGKSK